MTAACELDSHADTCCLGDVCLVLYTTGKAEVSGFTNSLESIKETPIITGVVAYDDPTTFETYLLYFHQALHLPMMNKCFLNPNQMREAGVTVNNVHLKFIKSEDRNHLSHSIAAPLSDESKQLVIPFDLVGVISSFTVRKPTWDEIKNTDPSKWDLNDLADADERKLRVDLESNTVRTKEPRDLHQRMACMVRVNTRTIADLRHRRQGTVDPVTLARRWGIGIPLAEKTASATTQLGVCDFSDSTGSKR